MGLFKKRVEPDEVQRLRSEIAAMGERLEHADAEKTQLAGHVDEMRRRLHDSDAEKSQLADRLDGIVTRLEAPIEPPPSDAPAVATADDVARLGDRLDELQARLDTIDRRITTITTELANQINEISGDVDRLGDRGDVPPTDEVVDELRDAQTRLANEQARYQIAFRQDLADLADRLRRS